MEQASAARVVGEIAERSRLYQRAGPLALVQSPRPVRAARARESRCGLRPHEQVRADDGTGVAPVSPPSGGHDSAGRAIGAAGTRPYLHRMEEPLNGIELYST